MDILLVRLTDEQRATLVECMTVEGYDLVAVASIVNTMHQYLVPVMELGGSYYMIERTGEMQEMPDEESELLHAVM